MDYSRRQWKTTASMQRYTGIHAFQNWRKPFFRAKQKAELGLDWITLWSVWQNANSPLVGPSARNVNLPPDHVAGLSLLFSQCIRCSMPNWSYFLTRTTPNSYTLCSSITSTPKAPLASPFPNSSSFPMPSHIWPTFLPTSHPSSPSDSSYMNRHIHMSPPTLFWVCLS